ncbi:MAG: hypothetical protein Q9P44_10320 [Anaerolineae bacterium]|nr:hypothetical protein [Anaerolineae bacterium]
MTRINLQIYIHPGQAEISYALQQKDGTSERFTAVIDTGAEVSVFPMRFLEGTNYRLSEKGKVKIAQAGIAGQDFEAIEAYVTIILEDASGNRTKPFEILAWFAQTRLALIGFQDILDRAVLHIDMPKRNGWLEIDT